MINKKAIVSGVKKVVATLNKHYPSQQDLNSPDKVERVVKDIYDRLHKNAATITKVGVAPKRIDINTGKVITDK
jgi:hypothetical protein